MYDQVVKCQRAGLCLSEHFLIVDVVVDDADTVQDALNQRAFRNGYC